MARTSQASSRKVVYAALAGNLAITATKFGAAWFTGSSAMTSEAIHSMVDTSNQALLLYGLWRAARPPDEIHPLGHGRELYFWSFIVALLIFSAGAGVSVYEGFHRLLHPMPLENLPVSYVVLGASLLFESASWRVAWREFRATSRGVSFFLAFRVSKDPATFTALFEDTAAVIGLFIAFAGTLASQLLDRPEMDGYASIGIGVLLAGTAMLLARECKGLLIGERANPALARSIGALTAAQAGVAAVEDVLTVHLAPDQVVAAVRVHFDEHLTTREIRAALAEVKRRVQDSHPEITELFLHL